MLNEKGLLNETPAIKLLLRVFELDLTGILYLKNGEILKVLYFNRGKLIWAISNSSEDKLENILVSLNMTNPEALINIEQDLNSSTTAGKTLVEQGIITLEELIEASKLQLKLIIDSVLTWGEGTFQFVKDTPPERLLSLDLKITDFVVKYIIEILDLQQVWQEIGSLQVNLQITEDKNKIRKFNLTERQTQLLDSFKKNQTLEQILAGYDGAHRNSLLKIIYFFIMADLVKKPVLSFDKTTETSQNEKPSLNSEGAEKEPQEPTNPSFSFVFDSQSDEDTPQELEEDTDVEEILSQVDSKKSNTKWFILISLLVITATILYFLQPENTNPFANIIKDDPTYEKGDKISPPQINSETVEEREFASQDEEPRNDKEALQTPPAVKDEDKSATTPPPNKTKKIDKKVIKDTKKPEADKKNTPPPSEESIYNYLKKGKLIIAGDMWKRSLGKSPYSYGILLELACMKTSIIKAHKEIHNKKGFYILNIKRGKRICFLAMYGKFKTLKDAEKELKQVPQYFWKQNPPRVVELKKYTK